MKPDEVKIRKMSDSRLIREGRRILGTNEDDMIQTPDGPMKFLEVTEGQREAHLRRLGLTPKKLVYLREIMDEMNRRAKVRLKWQAYLKS